MSRQLLNTSKVGDFTTSLCQPVPVLSPCSKVFSDVDRTSSKWVCAHFLDVFIGIDNIPPRHLFLRLNSPTSQPFFTGEMIQSLNHLHGALLDNFQHLHVCLVLKSSELDTAVQVWPHQCWIEGKDHLPRPVGNTLPNEAQDTVSLLCINDTLLTHVQLGAHQGLQVVFCKTAFQLGGHQQMLVPGVVPPQEQDFAFLLVECHEVPVSPFCNLLRSLWLAASHYGLSSTPPKPLVTGLQLDFVPLTTPLWAQLFNLFSIHLTVCSVSPYINSLYLRICGSQCQKSYWSPYRQYPLLSPHLPGLYLVVQFHTLH